MAHRLKKSESANAGIRRIARAEIDDALELLEESQADLEETVHELRKHFKKIRTVVRLVREELGDEAYQRENDAVRGLGLRLASTRDASVRVSALDRLRSTYPKELPADRILVIQTRLASRRRAALGRARRGSILATIGHELEALRRRIRTWPLRQEGFACLEPGLRRAYRQGRRWEAQAYASRKDEAFHEWRKRAKELRYDVDLLESVWPEPMKDLEKALHGLTDSLGDDHDFADLRQILSTSPKLTQGDKDVATVIELIDRRRSELQAAARPLGARIYAERARAFSRRVESYWNAWRSCPEG